ncbi:MAG: ribonuclease H-like domain-containing protein [Caldilineaceae bacterium]|nr:ribonuclease H-like domain-containing protein [Caldilineaceae bacterium]
MKYLSFDIETAKIVPDNEDLSDHRPLGITCYAIAWNLSSGIIKTKAGHGVNADGSPAPQMSRQECAQLVSGLLGAVAKGYVLLAHNGASFDFSVLAEESGLHSECVELAMGSVDTMLHIHCVKGFPVGLDAIAKGMGLSGKTEGMNGALAPQMWHDGEYDKVLEYVQQDVISTLEVALAVKKRRCLTWIAKSGRRNNLPIPQWLTVAEALRLPEPDTSWMSEPMPRSQFTGWMEAETVR